MRAHLLIPLALILAACSDNPTPKAVDAASLAPLSGRESALLIAAGGAEHQGNLAAAERDYESAISASTGHIEAHLALARLYLRTQQPEKADATLEKALLLQPGHPAANYMSGKLALARGDKQAALRRFNGGLSTLPGDKDLTTGAAIANDMLGQHRAAQALYLPALRAAKDTDITALRTNLALSYILSGEAKAALPLLKQELKTPGASPTIRHNLALAYSLTGDETLATRTLGPGADIAAHNATVARVRAYIADRSPTKTPPALTTGTPR